MRERERERAQRERAARHTEREMFEFEKGRCVRKGVYERAAGHDEASCMSAASSVESAMRAKGFRESQTESERERERESSNAERGMREVLEGCPCSDEREYFRTLVLVRFSIRFP